MRVPKSSKQLTTAINKNFLIRVSHKGESGSDLIGVSTFRALFKTANEANKFLKQALKSEKQVFTLNLRRGVQIDFVSR